MVIVSSAIAASILLYLSNRVIKNNKSRNVLHEDNYNKR